LASFRDNFGECYVVCNRIKVELSAREKLYRGRWDFEVWASRARALLAIDPPSFFSPLHFLVVAICSVFSFYFSCANWPFSDCFKLPRLVISSFVCGKCYLRQVFKTSCRLTFFLFFKTWSSICVPALVSL